MGWFDFLFKSEPAKPLKERRPSATQPKAITVKPIEEQPILKPETKKKVSVKVTNHDEIEKSIQLETESESTILELYCTVRPARLYPFHKIELLRLFDELEIEGDSVREALITSFKKAKDTGIMNEQQAADFIILELNGEGDKSRDLADKFAKQAIKKIR